MQNVRFGFLLTNRDYEKCLIFKKYKLDLIFNIKLNDWFYWRILYKKIKAASLFNSINYLKVLKMILKQISLIKISFVLNVI